MLYLIIRRQLLSLDIHPAESGPYPAYAGALSHLKTSFHFTLRDNRKLGSLLKVLHPTPAVCGLPKEEAYRFILENEAMTAVIIPVSSDGSILPERPTYM